MTQGNRGTLALDGQFEVKSEHTSAGHRIRVVGEMDLSVIDVVDREIRQAEEADSERIVLDLDQLEFLDAAGIRMLLDADARSKGKGRLQITRAASAQVQRVLDLTGAGEVLPFAA
jgi:anti-sigma B factor antagonist